MADTFAVNEAESDEGMVPVFISSNHDAEMEAMAVQGLLDANGIEAITIGPHVLPTLEFQVQVPTEFEAEAKRVIAEAKVSGPQAALDAELAGERGVVE